MLSGTVQPECRGRRSVSLLTPNTAVNGPDVVTRTSATMSTSGRRRAAPANDKICNACNHSHDGQWRGQGRAPGHLDRGDLEGLASNGFRELSAGDQLGPNVCGRGVRTDALSGRGLGRVGRRTALRSKLATQSVVSGLTAGPWLGPASTSMSAAAASYMAWLRATAAQAEETGAQARAAAAAYQTAFSSTVPPPLVAANRSRLVTLVATNLLGQNTPAIAANEAQYGEMWAPDSEAPCTRMRPARRSPGPRCRRSAPPQQNTNPSGAAGQSAAASQATGTAAGNAQSTIQQAFSAVPGALQSAGRGARCRRRSTGHDQRPDRRSSSTCRPVVATFAADIPLGSPRGRRPSLRRRRRLDRYPHRPRSSAAGTGKKPGPATGPRR